MRRIARKWRPSLWQVVGGALLGTLGMSFLGLVALRVFGPVIGYRLGAFLIAGVILLATLVLGLLLVRLILRPISSLAGRAAALRRDPMARPEPLAHYGTKELRDLGESVLDMAGRLQAREATIRSYTDHVTHEMKTPLSAMRAAAEMLGDMELGAEERGLVDTIGEAAMQMERQLDALRRAAAAREPGHQGIGRLAEVLPELHAAYPSLRLVASGVAQDLPLAASGLTIVLRQLLSNAASVGASEVRIEASPSRMVVADDGPGVSTGNRDRIFAPFFTTRRDSGGTGMGLTIAANLLAAHGGSIRLVDSPVGAAFEISFDEAVPSEASV
ncbi:MAG: HAMP domain-containing histidine kinase [Tabrizicola sp.]|nr:HAMP domain-containing histidine kinase [Tabrizicola sp.]